MIMQYIFKLLLGKRKLVLVFQHSYIYNIRVLSNIFICLSDRYKNMEIYKYKACLAQRSEHRTCNAMVIGSTPIAGLLLSHSKIS